jgi:DNA ligase 1
VKLLTALWRLLFAWLFFLTIVHAAEPPLLLAETYRQQVNVSHYLVSEKLDGVRAYWDGRQLISRCGNAFNVPAWFLAALPNCKLDGELWIGRGRFTEMSGIARRETPLNGDWKQVQYVLFELPGAAGSFVQRVRRMNEIVEEASVPWLQTAAQYRLPDHKALMKRLNELVKAGGEGLMLHRADAIYQTGRSDVLLKVKRWHDAEAIVIAHLPGKGKHAGRLGALKVRSVDGREFSLGTGFTDAQRVAPPPVGATVTYRYQELTSKGMPRFASFWRVRSDF